MFLLHHHDGCSYMILLLVTLLRYSRKRGLHVRILSCRPISHTTLHAPHGGGSTHSLFFLLLVRTYCYSRTVVSPFPHDHLFSAPLTTHSARSHRDTRNISMHCCCLRPCPLAASRVAWITTAAVRSSCSIINLLFNKWFVVACSIFYHQCIYHYFVAYY